MIRSVVAVALFLALLWGAGCGFNESPHKCMRPLDCPNGRQCVFSVADGCSGVGHCEDSPMCSPVLLGSSRFRACGCDGTNDVFDLTVPNNLSTGNYTRAQVCGWDRPIKSVDLCP